MVAVLMVGFFFLGNEFSKKNNPQTSYPENVLPTYAPYPTPNPNGRTYYNTVIYSTNSNGSEKIFTGKIYIGKNSGGPVQPTVGKDKLYYVSGSDIFEYDINTKTSKKIYTTADDISIVLIEYTSPNYLYITEGNIYFEPDKKPYLTLKKFDLNTASATTIASMEPTLYGGLNYIGKMGNANIVGTFGGDGCGGYGSIYKVENGAYNLVKKVGSGCIADPRYVGYSENLSSIITISVIGSDEVNQKYDFVYLTNVNTGENKAIFDLKRLNDTFKTSLKSTDKDVVYLVGTEKVYTLDLNTQSIISQSDITADFTNFYPDHISSDSKDVLLFVSESNSPHTQKYVIFDPASGQVLNEFQSPAEKDTLFGNYRSVNTLGILSNNLFSVSFGSNQSE